MAETVSAVIAVYNGEKYLRECIESVLGQTVPPDEVIVVDDGSTDGSAAIAEAFGAAVKLLRQQNAGQSAALALGLSQATGTCLAFNDADDLWTPQKLEWQLTALAAEPALDIVFGLSEQFASPELSDEQRRRFAPAVEVMPGLTLPAATVRRRAFDRIGGIDPTLRGAGITDWLARTAHAGLAHTMLPRIVYRRRLHATNYGRTHTAERDRNLLAVLRGQIDRRRAASRQS